MITDIGNAKYLTDVQWLRLMEIVCVDSPMMLHMPQGENCPIDLTFGGVYYVIHSDGSYEFTPVDEREDRE